MYNIALDVFFFIMLIWFVTWLVLAVKEIVIMLSEPEEEEEEDLPISPDWDMSDDDRDALDASGSF